MGYLYDMYQSIDLSTLAITISTTFILVHLVPYLFDPHGIRSYPGPFLAKFSHIWLAIVAKEEHRSEVIHELHKKYGTKDLPLSSRSTSF